jgi:VWFA-related protein
MDHRSAPAGLLVAAVLASVLSAEAQQRPSFRSGVDIVSLSVTVTGQSNRYITDLTQDDFLVYEDGVQQETTFFTRTQLPISLALLLDTSASMEERLQTAQEAAAGFTNRLRPEDMAQIISFDSRVEILETFTNDQQHLEQAIRQTSVGGSTSLYDAIYISLKELKKVRARTFDDVRRQAIVVLSDGYDTSSVLGFDEVLEQAKRSETSIYSIGLRSRDERSQRGFQEADFVLRQLSRETGGLAFFPEGVGDLAAIYEQIADELSNQYTLGYTTNNPRRDGMWRRIVVRVDRPSVTARTKQGYYAPRVN